MICPQCGKEHTPTSSNERKAKKEGRIPCCSRSCANMYKIKTHCKNGHIKVADNIINNGECRICRRARENENRKLRILNNSDWKQNNKEKVKEIRKRYASKHKNEVLKATKEWVSLNKDKVKTTTTKWREANPDKVKKYSKKSNRNIATNLTDYYIKALLEKQGIKKERASQELVEIKRHQLLFKRELTSLKNAIGGK